MERNHRKTRTGLVVSDKMDKTIVVKMEKRTRHPKYHKIIIRAVKVKAHDEKNECKMGDLVSLMETRPLSKDKRWRVVSVLERTINSDTDGE
ncbi:MAG: 30S ribosomal protein S17 [Candidatus Omnitrophota bacterium]